MIFRKAVLIIHGFAGGVYDAESIQYKLNPNWELDVYNFTLPGHERNLTHDVTYHEWLDSVDEHIEYLIKAGYRSIYVIGHSMGGLLATHAAVKYKEVKKLVLDRRENTRRRLCLGHDELRLLDTSFEKILNKAECLY